MSAFELIVEKARREFMESGGHLLKKQNSQRLPFCSINSKWGFLRFRKPFLQHKPDKQSSCLHESQWMFLEWCAILYKD